MKNWKIYLTIFGILIASFSLGYWSGYEQEKKNVLEIIDKMQYQQDWHYITGTDVAYGGSNITYGKWIYGDGTLNKIEDTIK